MLDELKALMTLIAIMIVLVYDSLMYKLFGDRGPLSKEEEENVEGKVIVVTGANKGIGKQIALEFAQRGAIVVIGCRNIIKGKESQQEIQNATLKDNVDLIPLDLTSMESVRQFAEAVSAKYPKIKMLINNAGVSGISDEVDKLTEDGFNPTMAANYFGHFLLTNLLLANLQNEVESRVIVISSFSMAVSKLDVNDINMQKSGFGVFNMLPYVNSKHANCLFVKELAKQLEQQENNNVHTYSMCPCFVYTDIYDNLTGFTAFSTNLGKFIFGRTCKQAVSEYVMYVCLSKKLDDETSGMMYRFRNTYRYGNRKLRNEDDMSEKLWDLSLSLTKLNDNDKAESV